MESILENEPMSEENEEVIRFLNTGCGCSGGVNGSPCSESISKEAIVFNHNNCKELSSTELDMVILANIQASDHSEQHGSKAGRKHKRRSRCSFHYKSIPICKKMFLFLYCISDSRFRSLKEHYGNHGITPRMHGNTKKRPSNALPYTVVEDITAFISNYVEENAIELPGRIPGYKDDDIKLLSSSESKANVWRTYRLSCESAGKMSIGYTKFVTLWNELFPNVVVAKPMTDLCGTCQQNTAKLQRSVNLPEDEKSACVKLQQEHLDWAKAERDYYRDACSKAEENFDSIRERFDFVKVHSPCSFNKTIHYSFDYAQQVHIPSNPMQPGPIYFKTPRKCGIFGRFCEAVPRQVNFLIDEAISCGKGANPTISYVHYYLENHGLGEKDVHLHADNCGGQNKNNYFIWYFAWRVINNLHESVIYSFLLAGHTKFGPDRCFGILKKAYKLNHISSLYELATVVESSSTNGINKVQLVGTHNGKSVVPVYDWATYLGQYFKKMPNITKFHHFRFSRKELGVVYCKARIFGPEIKVICCEKLMFYLTLTCPHISSQMD